MLYNKRLYAGLLVSSALLLSACGGSSDSDSTAPTLNNLFPNNNHAVQSRNVIISGQASDDKALKSVVITNGTNSVIAELNDGIFTAAVKATPGENTYSVVATDTSDNQTSSEERFYFGARASAGGAHSGVIQDNRLYTWGRNNKGQAGIGAITKLSDDPLTATAVHPISPTLLSITDDTIEADEVVFISLAFNQNASSALDNQGYVWSWGDGDDGQLGLGEAGDELIDEVDHTRPEKIANLSDVVAISRGGDHLLILKSDGRVFSLGNNSFGQLGDGTNINQDSPVAVPGMTNIVQISASSTSYAIDEDGRLWAWGKNNYGQLGNGTMDSDVHSTPTEIVLDETIVSIASSRGHALALTASGKVYAWGLNASSQVGMRTDDSDSADENSSSEVWDNNVLTPKLLPWFDDAIAVWAKGNQSFVQRSDGKIYPWGQNMFGTLGIESDDDVTQPNSPILELENVTDLGNGALHTLAIRNDGSLFSWGWSFEGSLGGGEDMINRWTYKLPVLLSLPEN